MIKKILVLFIVGIFLICLPLELLSQENQPQNSDRIKQLSLDAQLSFRKGEYEKAVEESLEVLKIDHYNAEAGRILNEAQKKINEAKIEKLFKEGIEYYDRGAYKLAIASWSKILELEPGNLKAVEKIQAAQAGIKEAHLREKQEAEKELIIPKEYKGFYAEDIEQVSKKISKLIEKAEAKVEQEKEKLRKEAEEKEKSEKQRKEAIKTAYAKGMDFYHKGEYKKAIEQWQNVLSLTGEDKSVLKKIEGARRQQAKKEERRMEKERRKEARQAEIEKRKGEKEKQELLKKQKAEEKKKIREEKKKKPEKKEKLRPAKRPEKRPKAKKERKEGKIREDKGKEGIRKRDKGKEGIEARKEKERIRRQRALKKKELEQAKLEKKRESEAKRKIAKKKKFMIEKTKEAPRMPAVISELTAHQKMIVSGLIETALQFHEQGKIDEAIKNYQKAREIDFYNHEIHNELGELYQEKGLFDEAEKEYLTAFGIKPDYGSRHYKNLVNFYKTQIEAELEMQDTIDELFKEGLKLYNNKEFNRAIEIWQKIIELDPENKKAQNYIDKAWKKILSE